jgi:hypothetical protein
MAAAEKARPTLAGSGSLTVTRSSATASSADGGSVAGRPTRRVTAVWNRWRPPSRSNRAASAIAALASTSRPVSTKLIEFRNPPRWLTATFSRSGAGWPRVPWSRTRSGPTCSTRTVSNRATTSGFS